MGTDPRDPDKAAGRDPTAGAAVAHHVVLAGEIDIDRADDLREIVQSFRRSAATDVAVDMAAVTFMGSTGISFLLRLRRTAAARGGVVRLLHIPEQCRRLLTVTATDSLFELD
jgi:anti-sigma B factor antagonist